MGMKKKQKQNINSSWFMALLLMSAMQHQIQTLHLLKLSSFIRLQLPTAFPQPFVH